MIQGTPPSFVGFAHRAMCVRRRAPLLAMLCLGALLGAAIVALLARGAAADTAAGPDLTVEISLNPAIPALNQPVTLNFLVKNIGTVDAVGTVTLHAYIDPAQQPPNQGTPGASYSYVGIPAGGQQLFTIPGHQFTSEGCGHKVYAWVNRDGGVTESNASNNLVALTVCVGNVSCQPDSYEATNEATTGDNTRTTARWFAENLAQAHSLCNAQNAAAADSDWVKFTVFSGVTYTLAATNPQDHTDALVDLDSSCGVVVSGGRSPVVWQSAVNGLCYAGIQQGGPIAGPLTAYSLTLTSATGVVDPFEPDDSCTGARDIVTDGSRQTHLFPKQGDQDWVKFSVDAGSTFAIFADNATQGTSPIVTVFAGCDQALAGNSLASSGNSPTAAVYYAQVTNQNPNSFGADKRYDLRVTVTACTPDTAEPDDSPAAARTSATGQPSIHNICPAGDQDWFKLALDAGKTYVLQTSDLAFAADTILTLFAPDGATQLGENDDYGYVSGSRLTFTPQTAGDYFARVRHAKAAANGPNTQYTFTVREGFCQPDAQEGAQGNNGPGDAASLAPNATPQANNFCADALNAGLGDQDWMAFSTAPGGRYDIYTSGLGPNSDTVLELYGGDGQTRLLRNDDAGAGLGASLVYTAATGGVHFVRVLQYNSNLTGDDTQYSLHLQADEPPTPTPSPTPTVAPTPTPTPTPPPPTTVLTTTQTFLLVNRQQMAQSYGEAAANALLEKLFALADDPNVAGTVIQVESDPAVATAFAAWSADAATLADVDLANAVTAAIRNRVMAFRANAPNLKYVVIAGSDRMIPFRRVLDQVGQGGGGSVTSIESSYAANVGDNSGDNSTVRAALTANMVLTDDYLVDTDPSVWQNRQGNEFELYVADYPVSRLVETPAEIGAFVDSYLAGARRIDATSGKALVTGYDFVQDSADNIAGLFTADQVAVDKTLIAAQWGGAALQATYLGASPRFDIYSANGHSSHTAMGTPDNVDLTASAVLAGAANLNGALVFSVGCHGGLNDPGILDLPQAFLARGANYVGNTGFGWGGSGVVYSEALMRTFTRELLREGTVAIGVALMAAKQKYYAQARTFNAYDAKILMQVTQYGLPMVEVTTGGALNDSDPFPSAESSFEPPTAFDRLAQGGAGYQLPGSFGAFDQESGSNGSSYTLDDNVLFEAGAPQQPLYFADISAPTAGDLRGAVFLGGVYQDAPGVDPVIALATNEYSADDTEPAFESAGFYPATPFTVRNGVGLGPAGDTLVLSLGQFKGGTTAGAADDAAGTSSTGVQRLYDQMSFSTYYSNSPDRNAASILSVDGVLNQAAGRGDIKVAATDGSGIYRAVVAFTAGEGRWASTDLAFDPAAQKWTGVITGAITTQFLVQVVDNAGNVAVNDNKGRYYTLAVPAPLATGKPLSGWNVYLPAMRRP